MRWRLTLTLNQKLAATALALGALATCAHVAPARTASVNAAEVLSAIARQQGRIAPAELAGWIVEGRADYRLIDVRDEKAYAAYHIPTAENVPLAALADSGLPRDAKTVLCDEDGVQAAQAWVVLAGRGYRGASTLAGGVRGWKDEVLFPAAAEAASAEAASAEQQARFERTASLARFFGGQPRAATQAGTMAPLPIAASPALAAPAVAVPAVPPGTGAASPARKKKEGC
jgi:rhodanese-related sulfurtransferase